MFFTLNFDPIVKSFKIKTRQVFTIYLLCFLIGSTFLNLKAYAIIGNILDNKELPLFSCAFVFIKGNQITLCSGEVISENQLLTAAHCLEQGLPDYIFCANKKKYKPIKKQIDPNYLKNDHSDHALLQIDSSFTSIDPVQLPENHKQINELLTKRNVRIFGYGWNAEGTLGKLLGINAELVNDLSFGPEVVALGTSNYPMPGDSGSGLIGRIKDTDPYIRIGTITRALRGLGAAHLLSAESLKWLKDLRHTPKDKQSCSSSFVKSPPLF